MKSYTKSCTKDCTKSCMKDCAKSCIKQSEVAWSNEFETLKHLKHLFSTTQDTTVILKSIQYYILEKKRYIAAITPSYGPT